MADSSTIGASFSQYEGNAGLGGYGLGVAKIDTRPIEDLAKYTMLYNREEYLQRQKQKEKELSEIAEYTALDLSTTIPKDAKILQEKFDKLNEFVRANPDALNYNSKDKWLEYNKMKADLKNDIKFAKIRSITNVARKEAIAADTNDERKKFLEQELQKNIDQTDIRTPLDYFQKYDLAPIEIPDNNGVEVDVTKAGSNQIFQRGFKLFDIKEAERAGAAFELGVGGVKASADANDKGANLRMMTVEQNPWIQMKDKLNGAIDNAKDQNGNVDMSKLSDLPIIKNIQAYNDYALQMKTAIANGSFTDKLGNKLSFMNIPFSANDYKEINLNDGLSAAELGVVASFSKWAGDQYSTKVVQTDDAIQQRGLDLEAARLAENKRQFNLGFGEKENKAWVGADSVLSTIQNAINTGNKISVNVRDGSGVKSSQGTIEIADANLLKSYARINKEGKTDVAPDRFYYHPDTKTMEVIYFDRDEDGNILNSKSGTKIKERIPMSLGDWTSNLVRDRFNADDGGAVNNLVMQVLGGTNYDLVDFAKKYKGKGPVAVTEESSSSRVNVNGPVADDDSKLSDAEYYNKYKKFRKK